MPNMRQEKRFLDFYENYADEIFRFCFFRVFDRERGRELMQESFMRLWQEIVKGKEIRNMRPFLYKIARNLVIDHARKKKEESLEAIQDTLRMPVDDTVRQRQDQAIDNQEATQVLQGIEEPYREAVTMRYLHGLKPREIAAITGQTANVVSVRIRRGLDQLRNKLEHYV
jgi:RNA polymerase sigma-70 factor, ECF subfamily